MVFELLKKLATGAARCSASSSERKQSGKAATSSQPAENDSEADANTVPFWDEEEARELMKALREELPLIARNLYNGALPECVEACVTACMEAAEEIISRAHEEVSRGWDPTAFVEGPCKLARRIATKGHHGR